MEKLKIIGIKNEEYLDGRIDSYQIKKEIDIHRKIIPFFLELGFNEEEILNKLDHIFQEGELIFVYGGLNLKAYIIVYEEDFKIIFDTPIKKDKMNKIFENYFSFEE